VETRLALASLSERAAALTGLLALVPAEAAARIRALAGGEGSG
jgi:hypothetical protein